MPDQQTSEEESPKRISLTEVELKVALSDHEAWLKYDGRSGKQAEFSGKDLTDAALSGLLVGANLQNAKLLQTRLAGSDLSSAICNNAELERSDLNGANLKNAELSSANLFRAKAQNASFEKANMQAARLLNADLSGANLAGVSAHSAVMNETELVDADLANADLSMVGLIGAKCRQATFRDAHLWKANLEGADFSWTSMQGANVAEANLAEVSLESADLRRASFIKANFDGSDGTSADLTNANLRDANLSDATLSGVTGLRTSALGGANVSNAKLPEDIAKFEGLEHVAEISRSARPVFLAVVGACVYSWLTIGTTTDPALVTNLAATPLPIIQTEIPIAFFYWAGPVILLALYAYLHMYLQRLWIGLASLPAIFTDGKPLDERAYPWLLTSLVRAYVPRLRADRPPLWWLQVVTSLFAAWALVPLTLLAYWLRYMPRRDWVGIIIIGIALVTAVWLAVAMYRIMRETLGLRDDKRSWRVWPEWVAATGTAALLLAVALSLMNASIPVHTALVRNYADLFGQDVSSKSEEWRDSAQNLDLVIGARLVGRDLSFAYARQAFLVKADLESATLSGADLTAANLWSANLFAANLQRAELERAHLNKATLINADLREADLVGANLTEADLISADLAGANLSFADLQYANLDGANLTGAILVGAKLGAAILKGADLSGAILSNTDRGGEDLLPAEGLSGEQLNDACGNDATRLPSGLFIGPCR